ncbi:transposon protein, putative, CACTA, En/Spm sub-class [Panicum miliaceum]|uniref:Transposon protein, putative, CACTA, En/Spm sub-class n=1 Tax=Panicum miliaceum TaxID=4540 RepID=A0A3L6SJJ7_PANMI|nr:transposon protein, putative, CACTA, En/Spm sub-class [Panicum miliaceum]
MRPARAPQSVAADWASGTVDGDDLGVGGNRTQAGRCASYRKIPEWEEQAEQLVQSSVTMLADGWDPRAVRYLLGRGAYYNPDGSLGFRDRAAEELGRKIQEAHEPATIGAFAPDRENDELPKSIPAAHVGPAMFHGGVDFHEHLGTYRSRGRRKSQREAEWHSHLQVVREEVTATNEKFRAELVESRGRGAPMAP